MFVKIEVRAFAKVIDRRHPLIVDDLDLRVVIEDLLPFSLILFDRSISS